MKRRLLSLVLATSMIFGSVNVAFADEAASAETELSSLERLNPLMMVR